MCEIGTEGHDGEAGAGVQRHMAVVKKKSERDGNLQKSAGGLGVRSVRE